MFTECSLNVPGAAPCGGEAARRGARVRAHAAGAHAAHATLRARGGGGRRFAHQRLLHQRGGVCTQMGGVGTFRSTQGTFRSTQGTFRSTQGTFRSTQGTFRSTQGTFRSTQGNVPNEVTVLKCSSMSEDILRKPSLRNTLPLVNYSCPKHVETCVLIPIV
jgi:hypothetical protein